MDLSDLQHLISFVKDQNPHESKAENPLREPVFQCAMCADNHLLCDLVVPVQCPPCSSAQFLECSQMA